MKKLHFQIISIFFGLILSVFLGEVIARVYFFGSAAFSYSKTNSFGILDNSGLLKYSEDKDLTYELLPNLDTKYKLVDFKTNAEGFRDTNHSANSKHKKIAVLGDSFTMGTGVATNEMYVSQTETLLNKDDNDTYEVFNFGVSGYALTNYVSILKRNALKYNPDLVVIGFCANNDQFEIGKDFLIDDFSIKPKKNVFWDSYLYKLVFIKLRSKENEPTVYTATNLQYIDQQFKTIEQVLIPQDIKGIIFYLDLVYDAKRVNQIKLLAEKNNLLFLDTSVFFKDKNLKSYIVNELDPHPNGKSNLIFAKKLTSYILGHKKIIFEN